MGCVINREWMLSLFNKIRTVVSEDIAVDVATRVALPYRQEGFDDAVAVFRITTYQRRWFWMNRLSLPNTGIYHKVESFHRHSRIYGICCTKNNGEKARSLLEKDSLDTSDT